MFREKKQRISQNADFNACPKDAQCDVTTRSV